jgi:NTE family protein
VTVVQLIYRRKAYETSSKDYEFSRATMREHWASGLRDVRRSLAHRGAIAEAARSRRCKTFDIPADEEETRA